MRIDRENREKKKVEEGKGSERDERGANEYTDRYGSVD